MESTNQSGVRLGAGASYTYTHIAGGVSNSPVVAGRESTQTLTTALDSSPLTALIAELRAIAPQLELPEKDAEDLRSDIDSLETTTDDPSGALRIWRSTRRIVGHSEVIALAERAESEITPERIQHVLDFGASLF